MPSSSQRWPQRWPADVAIWLDRKLGAEDKWSDQIENAIRKADVFIALISPHSNQSPFVQKEIQIALELDNMRRTDISFLIPVVLGTNVTIPESIAHLHALPWHDPNDEDALAKLVNHVSGLVSQTKHLA